MRRFTKTAHRFGLKVAWYSPVLEVLSPNATNGGRSMYRDHPSWVQTGLNGEPNVFYGSKSRVHWVDPETESAWMSFHTAYVDVLLDRIRKIAGTGVDAIWWTYRFSTTSQLHGPTWVPPRRPNFEADTGLQAPQQPDWSDTVWRRWIAWRYDEIVNLVDRMTVAAKSGASDVTIIIENTTMDHNASTMLGLDGSRFKTRSDVVQVWEVDVLSDGTAMRRAQLDDWISFIGMAKFAKAASGTKPSWMFTYGREEDDGLLVVAEALATANHPFESRVPTMATTVGALHFAGAHSDGSKRTTLGCLRASRRRKWRSTFSPESRDYVDQAEGTGLYATIAADDSSWWSDTRADSVYALTYLADYRGIIKWLVCNHVPFDVVVRPDEAELSRYRLPDGAVNLPPYPIAMRRRWTTMSRTAAASS